MFKKFIRTDDFMCPVILSDIHATSPNQVPDLIIRNERNEKVSAQPTNDLYDRAREIYYRAQRNRRSRSASIL